MRPLMSWRPAGVLFGLLCIVSGPSLNAQDAPLVPAVYCFAPGTPLATVESFYAALRGLTGPVADPQFYTNNRWSGATGSPRVLTWSFVPDGVTVPYQTGVSTFENRPSQLFSRMDSLFAAQGGRSKWIAQFQVCFDRWSALTGVSYTRIKSGANDWDDGEEYGSAGSATRGEIRIYMIAQDGVNNVLAYNFYPSTNPGTGGDMVMDAAENWGAASQNYRMLRNVVMHEHGHGLGMRHVCPTNETKLMEPILTMDFEGPQQDDIRGVQSLYGDDYEDNNDAGSARFVAALSAGTSFDFGTVPSPSVSNGAILSIDATSEVDFYRFTLPGGAAVSVSVLPVGLSYDSSVQNSNGSCSSGNPINSLTMANLNMQLLAPNGSTVLAAADSQPAGMAETLTDVPISTSGDYYLRVAATSVLGPQLYHVQLSVSNVDCNRNGVLDSLDLLNGTSTDCNGNGKLDECEPESDSNGDHLVDSCQWARGDFDLDGDTDVSDFGFLQSCLTGTVFVATGNCTRASLDGDTHVSKNDITLFRSCLSGSGVPLNWDCR